MDDSFRHDYVAASSTPDLALEYWTFSVHEGIEKPATHYDVAADLFVSPALKNQYTISSWSLMEFYGGQVVSLTRMELLLIKLEDRPADFDETMSDYSEL
jgi:hypothetical protein